MIKKTDQQRIEEILGVTIAYAKRDTKVMVIKLQKAFDEVRDDLIRSILNGEVRLSCTQLNGDTKITVTKK